MRHAGDCILFALCSAIVAGCGRLGYDTVGRPVASLPDGSSPDGQTGVPDAGVTGEDAGVVASWARSFGDGLDQRGSGVAVDADGNAYVTGFFTGSIDWSGQRIIAAGPSDLFVASVDVDGDLRWLLGFGGDGDDAGSRIIVDPAGRVLVAGKFAETVRFGEETLSGVGRTDALVLCLDTDGHVIWARSFGGPGPDEGSDIAVSPTGAIFVTADGQIDPSTDETGFLARLDRDGRLVWQVPAGAGADGGLSLGGLVAVDASGGPVIAASILGMAGDSDVGVDAYTPDGALRWRQVVGGPNDQIAGDIAIDRTGHVYAGGLIMETVDFGDGLVTLSETANAPFVASYEDDGSLRWGQVLRVSENGGVLGIVVGPDDLLSITGFFYRTIDFGDGAIWSAGAADAFLAQMDRSGRLVRSRILAGPGFDVGADVAVDSLGAVVGVGRFEGDASFGSLLLRAGMDGPIVLDVDGYVVRWTP
jgi:hypothetical protein